MQQPFLDFLDRHHVAVANHEIDVVERDALGIQAVFDDFLVIAAGMLLARHSFLGDRISDFAVAKQARADVVVVRVDPQNVGGLSGHEFCF